MVNKEEGYLKPKLFKLILDEFIPYSLKLNWRGEPMLNKDLIWMIKYAKVCGVHEVSFNTNGLLLNESNIIELGNSGLDWIIISVDGATKSTYEKIRVGGDFEKLVKNIILLNSIFVKIDNPPKIRIQICKQTDNENEISDWIKLFSKLSNQLRIGNLFNPQGMGKESLKQPKTCYQPWQRMTIGWNGDMFICPSDFLGKINLGNVRDKSIYEAWNSNETNNIRKSLKENGRQFNHLCNNCSSYC